MAKKANIYLDYNATAPLRPEVVQAMQEVLGLPLNASSSHRFGRQAKNISEEARRKLAEFINCFPQEIIWCGSASEANNAFVRQFCPSEVLVSDIEHSATLNACEGLEKLPVTADGVVDLAWLEKRLAEPNKPKLISVMFANNETGVIQPVAEVVKLAKAHGILVHTDAVQALGKAPFDVNLLGVDYVSIGFHKNGGPVGVAAMVVRDGAPFKAFICGGGQEFNRRAGTENIVAIAGVSAMIDCMSVGELKDVKSWMADLEKTITSQAPSVQIVGANAPRLGHVACIITPGVSREVQLMRMDLANVCVSAGSACTSGKTSPSHVLKAMGVPDELAGSAMRVSGGWNTKQSECEAFVREWLKMHNSSQPEPDSVAS